MKRLTTLFVAIFFVMIAVLLPVVVWGWSPVAPQTSTSLHGDTVRLVVFDDTSIHDILQWHELQSRRPVSHQDLQYHDVPNPGYVVLHPSSGNVFASDQWTVIAVTHDSAWRGLFTNDVAHHEVDPDGRQARFYIDIEMFGNTFDVKTLYVMPSQRSVPTPRPANVTLTVISDGIGGTTERTGLHNPGGYVGLSAGIAPSGYVFSEWRVVSPHTGVSFNGPHRAYRQDVEWNLPEGVTEVVVEAIFVPGTPRLVISVISPATLAQGRTPNRLGAWIGSGAYVDLFPGIIPGYAFSHWTINTPVFESSLPYYVHFTSISNDPRNIRVTWYIPPPTGLLDVIELEAHFRPVEVSGMPTQLTPPPDEDSVFVSISAVTRVGMITTPINPVGITPSQYVPGGFPTGSLPIFAGIPPAGYRFSHWETWSPIEPSINPSNSPNATASWSLHGWTSDMWVPMQAVFVPISAYEYETPPSGYHPGTGPQPGGGNDLNGGTIPALPPIWTWPEYGWTGPCASWPGCGGGWYDPCVTWPGPPELWPGGGIELPALPPIWTWPEYGWTGPCASWPGCGGGWYDPCVTWPGPPELWPGGGGMSGGESDVRLPWDRLPELYLPGGGGNGVVALPAPYPDAPWWQGQPPVGGWPGQPPTVGSPPANGGVWQQPPTVWPPVGGWPGQPPPIGGQPGQRPPAGWPPVGGWPGGIGTPPQGGGMRDSPPPAGWPGVGGGGVPGGGVGVVGLPPGSGVGGGAGLPSGGGAGGGVGLPGGVNGGTPGGGVGTPQDGGGGAGLPGGDAGTPGGPNAVHGASPGNGADVLGGADGVRPSDDDSYGDFIGIGVSDQDAAGIPPVGGLPGTGVSVFGPVPQTGVDHSTSSLPIFPKVAFAMGLLALFAARRRRP